MFCYKCGKEIPNESKFCLNCGTKQPEELTKIFNNSKSTQESTSDFITKTSETSYYKHSSPTLQRRVSESANNYNSAANMRKRTEIKPVKSSTETNASTYRNTSDSSSSTFDASRYKKAEEVSNTKSFESSASKVAPKSYESSLAKSKDANFSRTNSTLKNQEKTPSKVSDSPINKTTNSTQVRSFDPAAKNKGSRLETPFETALRMTVDKPESESLEIALKMLTSNSDDQRSVVQTSRDSSDASSFSSKESSYQHTIESKPINSVSTKELVSGSELKSTIDTNKLKISDQPIKKINEIPVTKQTESKAPALDILRPEEIIREIENSNSENLHTSEVAKQSETSSIKTFEIPPVKPIEIPPRPPVFEIPASLITNPEERGESPLSENKVATTLKKAMSRAADATTMLVTRTIAAKYTEFMAHQATRTEDDKAIVKASKYAHHPKNRAELEDLIFVKKVYLGDIDISEIIDLSHLFDCERRHINSSDINFDGIELWDTSRVIDMSGMFCFADTFNRPIGNWDMSNVIATKLMFYEAKSFNQPIGNWNTSNIMDMRFMFYEARSFNQPIGNWDTSKVINMSCMFHKAVNFNQPIGDWDTSNVVNMNGMFLLAKSFNKPIGKWNTSKVTDMGLMLCGCSFFNQPLDNWDTSKVTDMSSMLCGCSMFNYPIGNWNTSKVVDMEYMFAYCTRFNQDISKWNTSRVNNMKGMFQNARSFNQPIGKWDTSNVADMSKMFIQAKAFNQTIDNWVICNYTNIDDMFIGAESFNMN